MAGLFFVSYETWTVSPASAMAFSFIFLVRGVEQTLCS